MSLIVQKFGGSSVANAEKIKNAADIILQAYSNNNQVVVVVSAQGDTTDLLIQKAREIHSNPSRRETDVLLSTGEQITIALLAMEIEKRGFPVISLTGWQIPIRTDDEYSAAHIKSIETDRLKKELSKNKIVIVAGFQGINSANDITTLGRGGSDTTAVALAGTLRADVCQIYTDVEGVFTADPRIVPNAKKMSFVSYNEMLELAAQGARVLHDRSVEAAKLYDVNLEVLSSFKKCSGTIVRKLGQQNKTSVCGVAKDENISVISLRGIENSPGTAYNLFSLLLKNKVTIDTILQMYSDDNLIDITFSTSKDNHGETIATIEKLSDVIKYKSYEINNDLSKISVVGMDINKNSSVAANMFLALFNENINILLISTNNLKISVLVPSKDADRALCAVHDKFFE